MTGILILISINFDDFKWNFYSVIVLILNLTCEVLLHCVCHYLTQCATVILQKVQNVSEVVYISRTVNMT